ncbi:helix-turn-helix domain-containing protein [Salininema proteolyticum]|uniref:Helix-turn-helix domain-containing protein n=1 Tax=Salininema proteolyticum TaxID=1607685 RepID=A0ABV8TUH0_9ACTN
MFQQLVAACREYPVHGREKAFLNGVASFADENGFIPRTSNQQLAHWTGFSVRTVQRAVGDLEKRGVLVRHRRHNNANAFTILIDPASGGLRAADQNSRRPSVPPQPAPAPVAEPRPASPQAAPRPELPAPQPDDEPEKVAPITPTTSHIGTRWGIYGNGLTFIDAQIRDLLSRGWTQATLDKALGSRTDDVKHPFGVIRHRLENLTKRKPPTESGDMPRHKFKCWTCGVPTDNQSRSCESCAAERAEAKPKKRGWREIKAMIEATAEAKSDPDAEG